MKIEKYENLNSVQFATLKKAEDVASKLAASAFLSVIGKNVMISTPTVRLQAFQDAIDSIGEPDSMFAGISVGLSGDIEGVVMLLIEQEVAQGIIGTVLGIPDGDSLGVSALTEIGSVMTSSCVSAITMYSDLLVFPEVPCFGMDMLVALMSIPVIEFEQKMSDKLLLMEKNLKVDNVNIHCNMVLALTQPCLELLLSRLDSEAWAL
ncbi:MAG: chemotaxis protein CheC [Paludibacteraceae bacterium]